MIRQTAQQIADDIYAHLHGDTNYKAYYIGITNDIDRRLFREHNVNRTPHFAWWIWREAISKDHAQAVEEHFLNQGMKGDTGGGMDDSVYVYCYKITNYTRE